MEIKEIKQRLAQDVEGVVRHLYGAKNNWKITGDLLRVGDVDGATGDSLCMYLTGDRKGWWIDNAEGNHGDLIDLWVERRKLSRRDAFIEIKRYLNIHEPAFETVLKQFNKPTKLKLAKPIENISPAFEYLITQRFLTKEILEKFHIKAQIQNPSYQGVSNWILFPFEKNDETIFVKYLGVERIDGKKFKTEKGCKPILFGWQALDAKANYLIITEGEIDTISLTQLGFPSLSVPLGGGQKGSNDWINYEFESLDIFETIYLCFDPDKAGDTGLNDVANRLGRHLCRKLKLPYKDPNECLGKGFTHEDMQLCLDDAGYFDPAEIVTPMQMLDEIVEEFYPTKERVLLKPLWEAENVLLFPRPGVVLWSGILKSGKSAILNQGIILDGILQGEKCLLMSFELPAPQNMRWIIKQATAKQTPTKKHIELAVQWLTEKIWIYRVLQKVKIGDLFSVCEYCVKRYGVTSIVIDPLMKLGINKDDYQKQADFVNDLSWFSKQFNLIIHLVAHPRKPREGTEIHSSLEIGGAAELSALADAVFLINRNKSKEKILKEYKMYGSVNLKHLPEPERTRTLKALEGKSESEIIRYFEDQPDTSIINDAPRLEFSEVGSVHLWYDVPTMQFTTQGQPLRVYVPFDDTPF